MSDAILGNKIKKLMDYLDDGFSPNGGSLELYFLRKGHCFATYSYDEYNCALICSCWDMNLSCQRYDEQLYFHRISDVGQKVYEELQKKALKKAEEEYEKFEKEERNKKIRNFLNTKVYGKSTAFILEE